MSLPPSRESVTTINKDGSRRFIHPDSVSGRFTSWRMIAFIILIGIYVALPWIPVGGNPAVFLDIQNRQFHFFGLTFVTQDLWLAFFLVSGGAFSLFYLTALFGRVWCGWACPQTVFLEVVRCIERLIEGNARKRINLDAAPWTGSKTLKRWLKHTTFVLFAAVLAHVFLSYFVSLTSLYEMMRHAPAENWRSFLLVGLLTAALWFNFAWFREQFCIVLCPYGRLQSALIDKHSVVIGYDERRGEPRGKKGTEGAGDCVDCRRCVNVCPTGIDIRQGLQIECIGCAACIDACDTVMDKLLRPRGLVRYDSHAGLTGLKTKWIRPRIILYSILLCLGLAAMALALRTLKPATVSLLRMQGAPYFLDGGELRNQFLLRILNKRNRPEVYQVEITSAPGFLHATGIDEPVRVNALGDELRPLVITLPRKEFREGMKIQIRVRESSGNIVAEKNATLIGPFTP